MSESTKAPHAPLATINESVSTESATTESFNRMTEPTNPEFEAILNLLESALSPAATSYARSYAWAFWTSYVPLIRLLVHSLPTSLPVELPPSARLAVVVAEVGRALAPSADPEARAEGWEHWKRIAPALRTLVRSTVFGHDSP